ncbi:Crp/Fnr family transcriptional regulator [Microvirga massiliensis]|uniref:Crp/Fnr family transcriptional regulator n=1 Tax=Microvirga massiliensis TaxID=1033741 RepID=UPI00062B7114|nr:Crp/Fnr family transcriptional regulator [Microvirga massiliensis]
MAKLSGTQIRNGLLAVLPAEERTTLEALCTPVTLRQHDVLSEPYRPIEYVYFFEEGLSSEIAISPNGERIATGCVGREGLSGLSAFLGVDTSPHRTSMEVGGSALRIRAQDLRAAVDTDPLLKAVLLRYAHVFMVQIAATALAGGRYTIEQRLARGLLMCHDRIDCEDLPITHEFLSLMLGVRRSGITEALHMFEGERIIRAQRSLITIRSRPELVERAAGSYGAPEAEYERLIGVPWSSLRNGK